MTTTILLVRHGQTKSNVTGFYMGWSDEDLNEVGYSQAQRLSERLAAQPIDAVYTSPLQRARTTASIVAQPHQVEPEELDDLIEIRLGAWQGLHRDEIKRRWPDLWRQVTIDPSDVVFPDGESLNQVSERSIRAFQKIAEANHGRQAALVTHEIVVKVIAAHVLGVAHNIYRRLEINNASLTVVRMTNDRAQLITLNDISHLES